VPWIARAKKPGSPKLNVGESQALKGEESAAEELDFGKLELWVLKVEELLGLCDLAQHSRVGRRFEEPVVPPRVGGL
jgi:hypothetical protein